MVVLLPRAKIVKFLKVHVVAKRSKELDRKDLKNQSKIKRAPKKGCSNRSCITAELFQTNCRPSLVVIIVRSLINVSQTYTVFIPHQKWLFNYHISFSTTCGLFIGHIDFKGDPWKI